MRNTCREFRAPCIPAAVHYATATAVCLRAADAAAAAYSVEYFNLYTRVKLIGERGGAGCIRVFHH